MAEAPSTGTGPLACTFAEARRRWPELAVARDAQEQWRLLERRLRDGGTVLTAREDVMRVGRWGTATWAQGVGISGAIDVLWADSGLPQPGITKSVGLDLPAVHAWVAEVRRVRDAGECGEGVRAHLARCFCRRRVPWVGRPAH